MTPVRSAYLEAAATAVTLLRDPAVAAAWETPSALPEFRVSGLAGHLARQVFRVPQTLALEPPPERHISLLDHYGRSQWVGAGPHDEVSVYVRQTGEQDAADGPQALAERAAAALEEIQAALPAEPRDRVVALPWTDWALTLDDFLITRLVEIAVHGDDLAVSVGVETPALPQAVLDPVLTLLTELAVRRHGPTQVLRALSRAERAPATISAI